MLLFRLVLIASLANMGLTAGCSFNPGSVAAQTDATSDFKILEPKDGAEIQAGTKIQAKGEHRLSPKMHHVWLFLIDQFGNYYVQNPPAQMTEDGKWVQPNVQLGREICFLVAIQVNAQGHERLRGWVKAKDFGAKDKEDVQQVPGYRELHKIKVTTGN